MTLNVPKIDSRSAEEIVSSVKKKIRCDFRMMSVSNDNEQQKIIREFQSEFESKKKECQKLIVH